MFCYAQLLFFLLLRSNLAKGAAPDEHRNAKSRDSTAFGDLAAECSCSWSEWMNNNDYHPLVGDDNSYDNLRKHYEFCVVPSDIECRGVRSPDVPFRLLESEEVICNVSMGLVCKSRRYNKAIPDSDQSLFYCNDFEIRVECCVCPQISTTTGLSLEITTNVENFTATDILVADGMEKHPNTTHANTPTETLEHVLPLYIIIVIILATLIVFGIIICVVRWRTVNRKMSSKHSHQYVRTPVDHFQRPVSFTEVDNYVSERSSLSRSSLGGSYRPERFNKFDQGQLLFLQTDPMREKRELANSSPAHQDSLPRPDEDVPRRWFPDEYEQSLEKQGTKTAGGKNWLSRAFAPNTQKNMPFVDDVYNS